MKKIATFLALALTLLSSVFAQQSNPGFVYGQVPSAAQWNSYFSGKLDYSANGLPIIYGGTGSTSGNGALTSLAGAGTLGYYLRGNGTQVVLGQIQSSDVPGLAGGLLGSVPYQSAANTTAFLAGNTTTTVKFLSSLGNGTTAQVPTYTTSTGTGNVVLSLSPTISSPTMTTATISASTITTSTINGNTVTTGAGTLNLGGGTLALNGKTVTWNNSLTMSGTDGTTMTFPSTSATIARTDNSNTFSGTQTFSGTITGAALTSSFASPGAIGATSPSTIKGTSVTATTSFNTTNLLVSATAPSASGCGGGCTVSAPSGTAAFRVLTGSAVGASFNITLPAATTGWNCFAQNMTSQANAWIIRQSATSTTSITLTNYSAGSAAAFNANDEIAVNCMAY